MSLEDQFKKILSFYEEHQRTPRYREMLAMFGYNSTNEVHRLVEKLTKAGHVHKDHYGKLALDKKYVGLKILGAIEAGFPSPAEEELIDTITLDDFLIGNREATYMLTVQGESMIDAGIHPGDIVLVERGRTPQPGDIVVAEVDNGWTLKYLRKEGNKTYLEPANRKFKPIYPKEELNIAAVATAVIRKYKRV